MTRYLRRAPTRRERQTALAASLAAAVGIGAVAFYLVRAFLARDPVHEQERALRGGGPPGRRIGPGSR